jgi:hypothetical protein
MLGIDRKIAATTPKTPPRVTSGAQTAIFAAHPGM